MDDKVIDVHGLHFRWPGQQQPCLNIPAFSVSSGERVFLHGASGSGKSTLLALLGGVLLPEAGQIRIMGQDLRGVSAGKRDRFRVRHMGFIFQQFNLIPYLSVLDNVLLPCHFSAGRRRSAGGESKLHTEARRLLHHLDLASDLWHRPAARLSVGQQQRVAAARALIGHPELIVADEPTSALDADRQTAFLDLLIRECDEAKSTLIFVSHDLRLAEHFGRIVALADLQLPPRTATGVTT